VGQGPGSPEGRYIKWHTISNADESVVEYVWRIAARPLVPAGIAIYGSIYDVRTGRLVEVPDAKRAA
jgi:carbonic anhydrase